MTKRVLALVACLLVLVASGCDDSNGSGSGGTDSIDSGRVTEALSFVPEGAPLFAFTDWTQMRGFAGAEDLSGDASPDETTAFFLALNEPNSPLMGTLATFQYPDHRNDWGWNELDLDWEAEITATSGPPISVLGFSDDFDLEQITSKLTERDFEVSETQGATLYTNDGILDLIAEEGNTAPSLMSVAVLEDDNIMIVGGTEEALAAHSGESSAASDESYAALAERYAGAASVAITPGETCSQGNAALDEFRGNPYESLAMAYLVEGESETTGSITLRYADEGDAEADLELREKAITEGTSLRTNQPYGELLSLNNAAVDGTDLVLDVEPVDGGLQLFDLLLSRDLLFALC